MELGDRATILVKVTASGNKKPTGTVTISIRSWTRSTGRFFTETKQCHRGRVAFRTPKLLKRGIYMLTFWFRATPGSVWKDSSRSIALRVTRQFSG